MRTFCSEDADETGSVENLTAEAQAYYFRRYDGEDECLAGDGKFGFIEPFCGSDSDDGDQVDL
jgi:hypothetical protein